MSGIGSILKSAETRLRAYQPIVPGMILCGTIAMAATFLSQHYGAPVMLFALLLGMALNPISEDGPLTPGVKFASGDLLKIGVALLGVRLTSGDVLELGALPPLLAIAGAALTIGAGCLMARFLGYSTPFGILTGGAVGICGASAALALSSVLPKGKGGITERDTIFTVLAVTTLSTIAMIAYPLISDALGLAHREAGIFIGATVHDVAQVVGAGYSISPETGDIATMTKLFRVALLVPVIAAVMLLVRSQGQGGEGEATAPNRMMLPPFLIGFIILVGLNSFGFIPSAVQWALSKTSSWCLVAAISGLGIKTSLRDIGQLGPLALAIVVIETVLIMGLALAVVA
jgi:uncharacterized integral membrane protein (TIGR00698 family)